MNAVQILMMHRTPISLYNYGYLYNYYAFNSGNIAPDGWHVATYNDYVTSFGVNSYERILINNSLSNFVLSGERSYNASFSSSELLGYYFCKFSETQMYYFVLKSDSYASLYPHDYNNPYGMSIRLVKNDNINPGTVSDYDGNSYGCATINGLVWTTSNWKCTHLSDGTLIPNVTDNSEWINTTNIARCAYNNDESYV